MQWLQDNYSLLILIAIIATYFIISGKQSLMKWLLYAVTLAEEDLGAGTGRLKLVQVYSDFVANYPIFSKIIPFALFSYWVDIVLKEMRDMLEKNQKINAIVKGDD